MIDGKPSIFISYRRNDPTAQPGAVEDWLKIRYGDAQVFRDTTTLSPGKEFPKEIEGYLKESDVVLAIIGERYEMVLQ